MNWYLQVLKNYANFSGRARRKEYWMFFLFNVMIGLILKMIDLEFFGHNLFNTIYALAVLIPGIAVFVRRMHDIGKSGWNAFWGLIPIIGAILLIVWLCKEGEYNSNKWGENPKK